MVRHPALLRRTVDRREVQLVFGRAKVEHEVEDGLLHLVGTAVGFVHLVDDHDGLQTQLDGLLQHKTGLWHGAFEGVDQKQHAVGHIQDALHLAAKVGVAGSVDDIDFRVLVANGHILRKDGDAAFALEVVVVQDELARGLVRLLEELRLVEDTVDEGGFAVVNVGDNSYISDILHFNKNCRKNSIGKVTK